jgi:hypothetical protein
MSAVGREDKMRRRPYVPILNTGDVFVAGHIHALQVEVEKDSYSSKVLHSLRQRLQGYRDELLDSLREELNEVGFDPSTCESPRVITVPVPEGGTQMLLRWEERQPALPDAPVLLVTSSVAQMPHYETSIYWQRKRPGHETVPSRQKIDDSLVVALINLIEWVKECSYEVLCLTKYVSTDSDRWHRLLASFEFLRAREGGILISYPRLFPSDVFRMFGPMPVETRSEWLASINDPNIAKHTVLFAMLRIAEEWVDAGRQAGRLPRQRLAKTLEAAEYTARTLHGYVLALARESVRIPGELTVDGFVTWEH